MSIPYGDDAESARAVTAADTLNPTNSFPARLRHGGTKRRKVRKPLVLEFLTRIDRDGLDALEVLSREDRGYSPALARRSPTSAEVAGLLLRELGILDHMAGSPVNHSEERTAAIGLLLQKRAFEGLDEVEGLALLDRLELASNPDADGRVELARFRKRHGREPTNLPTAIMEALEAQFESNERVVGQPLGDRPYSKQKAAQLRRELGHAFLEGSPEYQARRVREWKRGYRKRGDLPAK